MPDCDTERFASGEELLRETKRFDIVFLDIQMDGINGIQAAKTLRDRNLQRYLPGLWKRQKGKEIKGRAVLYQVKWQNGYFEPGAYSIR